MSAKNVALIGMPGCGKSTVGRLLADRLGWAFVDLDREIERVAGRKLWQINESEGFDGLGRREESAALSLDCAETVIAPGGSLVYRDAAMLHLRRIARVLYLRADADVLADRAGDLKLRGVVIAPGMTYADLVAERDPLYRRFAHATIDATPPAADVAASINIS